MLEHPQSGEDDEADQPPGERLPIVEQNLDDICVGGWIVGDLELQDEQREHNGEKTIGQSTKALGSVEGALFAHQDIKPPVMRGCGDIFVALAQWSRGAILEHPTNRWRRRPATQLSIIWPRGH